MRKSRFVLLILLLVALCLPGFCFNPATPPSQRNAILFSWDGVQKDHLNECFSRNELPNLAKLISEGNMVKIDISGHNTDTKAGHTQMLTGYDPDVTGVMSNSKFKAIPAGLSIFERLEKQFGDDNIATIMVTGKTHHIGSCPPSTPEQIAQAKAQLEKIKARNKPNNKTGIADPDAAAQAQQKRKAQVQRLNAIIQNTDGEPFFHVSKNIDIWDGEKSRTCEVNGPLMINYLDKYGKGRFFAFYHFSDPDHTGHNHGENSKEHNDAIIACDKWLGEIVKKLKDLGVYDKTMIFVTADHGFDEGKTSHSNAPYVFLASNVKSLKRDGHQRDIAPTILNEMGVDISKLEPKFKGVVLTK
ncbi:MAG: alkaline phosphatase family protein [Armatimonadetes bacterium]|nr:alkaline phosphatase family protein [Armatimonadota bacterium]